MFDDEYIASFKVVDDGEEPKRTRQARNPRTNRDAPGMGLLNEHVYKYFRFTGYFLGLTRRLFAQLLAYDFARQERENQEARPYYVERDRKNKE